MKRDAITCLVARFMVVGACENVKREFYLSLPTLRLLGELWVPVKYDHMISHFCLGTDVEVVGKSVHGLFKKVVRNTLFSVFFQTTQWRFFFPYLYNKVLPEG